MNKLPLSTDEIWREHVIGLAGIQGCAGAVGCAGAQGVQGLTGIQDPAEIIQKKIKAGDKNVERYIENLNNKLERFTNKIK